MEISLADRKQPDHRDFEHSGDLLMQDFQDAWKALQEKLAISEKAGSPEITEKLNKLIAARKQLLQNLPSSMIEQREWTDVVSLTKQILELIEEL